MFSSIIPVLHVALLYMCSQAKTQYKFRSGVQYEVERCVADFFH